MRIFVATGNEHKLRELAPLFPGHELLRPSDAGVDFDPEETGATFLENSLLKARALHALVRQPVLADDSGLCVDGLGGEPGIRSARYGQESGGRPLSAEERNALLLARCASLKNRACRFVCCMSLVLSADRFYCVQEAMEGLLLAEPRGKGGFGYDPIVLVEGRGLSVAELPEGEKNMISHRGRAAARMAALMAGI